MDCAVLAAAQLEKLDECQRQLLETMRKERGDSERILQVESVFAAIPEYAKKLQQLSVRMQALSTQTASMRERASKLAAEQLLPEEDSPPSAT